MDFFERQDKARRNTKWLVIYFLIACAFIVASVYLAALFAFQGLGNQRHRVHEPDFSQPRFVFWNREIFTYAALGTLAVISCGSAYRISQLASGGSGVAESLGGRLLLPNTTDLNERKLLNVVEEMALASGVPVPQVYVMDGEAGINAFAAGNTPNDAVIGVTRGCMELLKRDELQGVIGHEFSHILNGDMRLNLRLMGIIFGILCLAIIGRILLQTRGKKNPLPLVGLALLIIGWAGVFFGRLIQAAVSRQREFLADASAVQFTRNPDGLAGALKKIAVFAEGSRIENAHAQEASHMFFGNALKPSFLNGFATHPRVEDRIRAIQPSWDGSFPKVVLPDIEPTPRRQTAHMPAVIPIPFPGRPGMAAGFAPQTVRTQTVLPTMGRPTPLHLRYAESLRDSLPESVQAAAHEPLGAVALVYALLLSHDPATREAQLKELAQHATGTICEKTSALLPEVAPLAARARLPLVNLALPALRGLRPEEFSQFSRTLQWLIESDEQVDLFEFVLQKIVHRQLTRQFSKQRPPVVQFYTVRPLVGDCVALLSALAHASSADATEVENAFTKGAPYLRAGDGLVSLLPREECGLEQVDAALNRLELAVPQIKKNVLEACVQTVGADGVIQEGEAELLRAVSEALDCPMPPFVELQETAA